MTATQRVSEHLNATLHTLFARDTDLYLLGEDILDPYGGAFTITKGLSSRYPHRVLTTPVSEAGVLGVAGGLALCGNRVLVEIMFGDFLALAFDQVLNFATKAVAMYGRRVPMRMVIRCPVGGNRGYGPTHSQSPQKHLVGIPYLRLYEMSRFHDAGCLLTEAFDTGQPSILFEDKVLYTRRMQPPGSIDDRFEVELVGGPAGWATVRPTRSRNPDIVVIAPGGAADRALDAARTLLDEDGISVHVFVPARLHPLDLGPVLPLIDCAGRAAVAEEATAGGTWGADVAHQIHVRLWNRLRAPVSLVTSADDVIPAAPHLERQVLLQSETILRAVRAGLGLSERTAAPTPPPVEAAGLAGSPEPGVHVTVPKLNNNDESYLVVEWLCQDGAEVAADTPVVVVETSKAQVDLPAGAPGRLRRMVPAGAQCRVGDRLGLLLPPTSHRDVTKPRHADQEDDHG